MRPQPKHVIRQDGSEIDMDSRRAEAVAAQRRTEQRLLRAATPSNPVKLRQPNLAELSDANRRNSFLDIFRSKHFLKSLLKRSAVGIMGTAAFLGIVDTSKGSDTPALNTPYTATGQETPYDIAKTVMGDKEEHRNLQDKLAEDANRDGVPGYQPGEQVNMPEQYIEHLEQQKASRP